MQHFHRFLSLQILRSSSDVVVDAECNAKRNGKECEFMQEKLDSLGQSDLASRLTLNCTPSFVQPDLVNDLPVTVLDVWDDCALSQQVKDDVYKCYPQAKLAHLKT